jgi:hypothetical protein
MLNYYFHSLKSPTPSMNRIIGFGILFLLCLGPISTRAGGGCTFSNSCGSATSLSCGTNYSMSNSSCDIVSQCCGCWAGGCAGTCAVCDNPPAHFDDCQSTVMGISCFIEGTFCGSPENTQWARLCAPTTGTYTFNYNSISCTGGGTSLQVGLYDAGITCATTDQAAMQFCNGSLTGSTSINASLTAGQCYLLVFDGNAGAVCTWSFNIVCPPLPVVLASFYGEFQDNRSIQLRWETTNEQNSKEFVVVRYYDDLEWDYSLSLDEQMNQRERSELSPVPSSAGGEQGATYSITDFGANRIGQYSYELYQYDLDGTRHFLGQSEVYVGSPSKPALLNAYYSSTQQHFIVDFQTHQVLPAMVEMFDLSGKLVYSEFLGEMPAGYHTARVSGQSLPKGIYLLNLKIGSKAYRQKLLLR